MEKKYLFKLKKGNKFFLYNKKQFEEFLEIEYAPALNFDSLKIEKKVKKLCIKAGKDGLLTKENIWFGCYYEKEIQSHFIPDVYVKWINDVKEYGLFANRDFSLNSFLGEYTGTVRKYKKIIDDKNSYLFEYSIGYKKTPFTIDARERGSLIRFVNHSFKPNVTPLNVFLDGIMHIIFRTNRIVRKDEELTYDYGPLYWKRREKPIGSK
jgi:SET domain-containing protein